MCEEQLGDRDIPRSHGLMERCYIVPVACIGICSAFQQKSSHLGGWALRHLAHVGDAMKCRFSVCIHVGGASSVSQHQPHELWLQGFDRMVQQRCSLFVTQTRQLGLMLELLGTALAIAEVDRSDNRDGGTPFHQKRHDVGGLSASRQRQGGEIPPLLVDHSPTSDELSDQRQITVLRGHQQRCAPPAVLTVGIDTPSQQARDATLLTPHGLTERCDVIASHAACPHVAQSICVLFRVSGYTLAWRKHDPSSANSQTCHKRPRTTWDSSSSKARFASHQCQYRCTSAF